MKLRIFVTATGEPKRVLIDEEEIAGLKDMRIEHLADGRALATLEFYPDAVEYVEIEPGP